MEEVVKKNKSYEFAFLLRLGASVEIVKELLEKYGFSVAQEGPVVANQRLAYPIKKQNAAQFGYLMVNAPEDVSLAMQGISRELELRAEVLRFMFVSPAPVKKPRARSEKPRKAKERKEEIMPQVDRIDSLSNEKLEETLEEILK